MRVPLTAAAVLMIAGVLLAQSPDDHQQQCRAADADVSIAGCSALIASGQEAGDGLAAAYFNRAIAYRDKGDEDRAIADLTFVVTNKPAAGAAWTARGLAHAAKNELAPAIDDFSRAIDLDPANGKALFNRGVARFGQGQYDQAQQDFDATLRAAPQFPAVSRYRDLIAAWRSCADARSENRIAQCTAVTVLAPTLDPRWSQTGVPDALVNRGVAFRSAGQHLSAFDDFDAAAALNPASADAHRGRGIEYFNRADFEHAQNDFETAIASDGRDAQSLYGRGAAKQWRGDISGGSVDVGSATSLQGDIAGQMAGFGIGLPPPAPPAAKPRANYGLAVALLALLIAVAALAWWLLSKQVSAGPSDNQPVG